MKEKNICLRSAEKLGFPTTNDPPCFIAEQLHKSKQFVTMTQGTMGHKGAGPSHPFYKIRRYAHRELKHSYSILRLLEGI